MMHLRRSPRPALRPFVESLWTTDERDAPPAVGSGREHVLPTGMMHVVFRLAEDPLRLFNGVDDGVGETVGVAVVGGARASFYAREVTTPVCAVGAQLRPGAAQALFHFDADELAGRHTRLDDLWSQSAASIREQLCETPSLEQRLDLLDAILSERLPAVRGVHPAVAQALQQFSMAPGRIRDVVRDTGYSHRTFISLYRRAVGLTPKSYCRVLRFQRTLPGLFAANVSQVDVAAEAGYSDQPHFSREFREFAGLAPRDYVRASPRSAHHVPVALRRRQA